MATDIDLRTISSFSSLPESSLSSLLDAPTADTVRSLLKGIEKSAKECEAFKSHKVKLEVELETVVRTNESKVKVLQSSRDKALSDVQKLRSDVQSAETARAKAESDLEQLRSSTSSEASENTRLQSRITSLETSNRDITAVLESKSKAHERLSQDLSSQHQKASELRRNITDLEQKVQSANSSVSSSKFREQSLQLEIDQLKKNNEWLQNERSIKAEEHTNFRKEKNARLTALSRSNEQYISEVESLRRSEAALKHRVEELSNRCEDLLQDVQKVQEEKQSEANSHLTELEAINRLAILRQNQAETAQDRLNEVQNDLEELREDSAEELGRLRAEAETDHAEKQAAENKIAELEASVNRLQSDVEHARVQPSTPQQPINGNGVSTPMRPSTPLGIFSPSSSSRLKGQPSVTQMFTEYKKLEKELAAAKRDNEQLQNSLDGMLQDLESCKPEEDELRADHSRLQNELLEVSSLVDQANYEKDESARHMRAYQGQLEAKIKEVEVLSQQLRDAGSEIRFLLMEQYVREHGDELTREDFNKMQRTADEAMQQEMASLSETQQVVNQKLIVFKNIADLQEQNENQLKTIRNLVANLESNESQEKQQKVAATESELQEAQAEVTRLRAEIKTQLTHAKSFAKEREMFRNMLKRGGNASGQITDFSRSMPIAAGGSPNRGFDESSINGSGTDLSKVLKDMQDNFEVHRQEFQTTTTMLRAQVDDLTKRNSQVQTESSRALGQLTAASQRYEMLQANFNMMKTENSELQKRSYATSEDAAKQAVKVQQAGEELVEARGMLDSLRRESANLKAEKDIWNDIRKRLVEDNESLRNERGRLDQLNANLQSLLNEREQTDGEQRRRLQAQAESLETELHTAKRKLDDEIEDNKKTSLRREYEQEQAQKRVDDLMTSLGSVREELASAKTSKDHLQARVDELTVELRSAEERLEIYTRPQVDSQSTNAEEGVSKEEELNIQVSELKRDLELKTSELERTTEQIETYKNIAQEAEERLQETNETADQYRENVEETIAGKDAEIKDLKQRVEDISSELTTTNSELSKLRDDQSGSDRRLDEQKTQFEAEIERLKEQESRATEQAQFNLEASKAQAEIATQAQQNYENEIVKNAEAIKSAQSARSEANQLRMEVVDLRTQTESAQTTLQQKESSWSEMKDRYDQELTDLKQRREEVAKQNSILHGQLESLTQQITSLQKDRANLATGESNTDSSSNLESLQELIKYLRREKEIVDVQYHLSKMEENRLRQQLNFAHSKLDEAQLQLNQQRRVEGDSDRNAQSHKKLMDTLNELNLFRESSVTLRAEAKQANQALAAKTEQVEKLETQIHPLQARISELENLDELHKGEMKLVQEDRDRWQQRNQTILSKYNRVDPEEIDAMKDKVIELEKERDETVAARDSLQTQVDGFAEQIESARSELRARLGEQFKAKVKELNNKIRDKQAEFDTLAEEKSNLQNELDVVREQLESAHNQSGSAAQVNGDVAQSPGEVGEGVSELEARVTSLQASIEEKDQEISRLKSEHEEKVKVRLNEMRETLNKRLADVKQELQKAKDTAVEELRERLESEHRQELEDLRSQSVPISAELQKSAPVQSDAQPSPINFAELPSEALLAMPDPQAKYLANAHPAIKSMLNGTIRAQIAKRLKEAQTEFEKELEKARAESGTGPSSEQLQEIETRFASERDTMIQEKEVEFAAEKEQMEKDFEERLTSEKEELNTQHQAELEAQKKLFSEESEEKIKHQVAMAEQMATKKSGLQLNMARNQANAANAKVNGVKKAAEETPTRSVSEVWEEVKDLKPAPAAQANAASSPAKTAAAPAAPPAAPPAANAEEAKESPKQPTADAKPAPTARPAPSAQAASSIPAKTAPVPATNALSRASALPQPGGRGGTSIRGRGGIPGPAGRGSALPRAGGNARRGNRVSSIGTGIPNAHGAGRGGASAASPRTSLNPGANQFVPGPGAQAGAKRAREDGEAGDGGQGKRVRGSSQGP